MSKGQLGKYKKYIEALVPGSGGWFGYRWANRAHSQIHKDGSPVKNPCPLMGTVDFVGQWERQRGNQ